MSNSQYIVSARKYRPATFNSVVGQSALTQTLKGAITSGRLAQAYLFCGPRGVGKTSCARIFARTINCLNLTPEGEACGECESCRAIEEGSSYNIVELDAASNNSVDNIRQLIDQVSVPPQTGRYRVFIIDEVHMLSSSAFNAFLKTLEEPPAHVIFILATTEKHKVIPTILSRCQIYDFKRITVQDMVEHLKYVADTEGIVADPMALNVIAMKADGAMRDALSIFDQVAASSMGNITYASALENLNVLDYEYYFRLVDAFMEGNVQEALLIYKEIRDQGFDSLFFVGGLATHVRNVMMAADPRTVPLLEVGKETADRYLEQGAKVPIAWNYQALRLLNDCDLNYRVSTNKQLLVELTLVCLATILGDPQPPKREKASIPDIPKAVPQPQLAPQAQASPLPPAAPQTTVSQQQAQATTHKAAQVTTVETPRAPGAFATQPRTVGKRTVTTRISTSPKAKESQKAVTSAPPQDKSADTAPVESPATQTASPMDINQAWEAYMQEHPKKHILLSAMRNGKPSDMGENVFGFSVVSPAQKTEFENHMTDLVTFLREKTGNAALKLQVEVSDDVENLQAAYQPPAEFVKKAMDENPVLAELLEGTESELIG